MFILAAPISALFTLNPDTYAGVTEALVVLGEILLNSFVSVPN